MVVLLCWYGKGFIQFLSHKAYWQRIINEKHPEFAFQLTDVRETLINPNEIRLSLRDQSVQVFYKFQEGYAIISVIKVLNGVGFLVTAYQTRPADPKGKKLWPK